MAAARWLDDLRAPLGRALSLSALIRDDRADVTVAALERSGAAAAVVSGDGRLRAANPRFVARLGNYLLEERRGLRFADRLLQARFVEALAAVDQAIVPRSLAVAAADDQPPCVMHLLPLRRQARDVFGWDGVLILLAEAANASIPGADLLRLLFDLTPAEAKLTRRLLEGWSPVDAASALGISEHTARTHLRRVFAKTGVTRQTELTRLLLGLGMPH
jgi:DNA-binding CsgD family transcriptional regulator